MSYQFEVRMVGEDLSPEKVSSRDVAELIASVEQMIAAIVARDNPSLGIDESEVVVGLASVRQGSYVLQFETVYETQSQAALAATAQAVSSGQYDTLPYKSVEALRTVRKITRKYKTDTQLWENNGHHRQLAIVSPTTEIEVESKLVEGKTTLYGYVSGIMGDDPPRVRMRLLDGTMFTCNVTRANNLHVAKQIGQRLYTVVGIRGVAKWDASDMSLQYFLVEELTTYRKKPVDVALDALHKITAQDYADVDIDSLVADLRGYETEDIQ